MNAPTSHQVNVWSEIFDFLLSQPTVEAVANFRVSDEFQNYSFYLLEASKNGTLSPQEKIHLEQIAQLDRFMSLLKAYAHTKLK